MIDLTNEEYDVLADMNWDCWPQEYAWAAVQTFKFKNNLMTDEERAAWIKRLEAVCVGENYD
jgi:hypothetical protein